MSTGRSRRAASEAELVDRGDPRPCARYGSKRSKALGTRGRLPLEHPLG
jgi:hypothetical protein